MIKASIDTRQLDRLFTELEARSINLRPALVAIEQEILDSVEETFDQEGPGWKPLHPKTQAERARAGKSGKILQRDGQLAASIQRGGDIVGNTVIVGTNRPGARAIQDGAVQRVTPKQRVFLGKALNLWMKVGAKLEMPARPFLDITDEVVTEAEKILAEHLVKGI